MVVGSFVIRYYLFNSYFFFIDIDNVFIRVEFGLWYDNEYKWVKCIVIFFRKFLGNFIDLDYCMMLFNFYVKF